jgi:general secretion pathway protein D
VKGKVDVWSTHPVTKDEAVDLLNSMLNKNGYAAIRNGRMLTIVSKDEAIHGDIPVKTGNDPGAIPKNDEIVTQIIPIRFVEAEQLVKDLSPMVSSHATIVANEAGNSIAVTDTQANIRHLVEIIKAIDSSAEDETELRVFHLKHHDPTEIANLLTGLFSGQGNTSGSQTPIRFGGPGGGFGAVVRRIWRWRFRWVCRTCSGGPARQPALPPTVRRRGSRSGRRSLPWPIRARLPWRSPRRRT